MQTLLMEPFEFKFCTTLVFKSATDVLMCLFYFAGLSRSTDLNCSSFEDYEGGGEIKSTDGYHLWFHSVNMDNNTQSLIEYKNVTQLRVCGNIINHDSAARAINK